MEDKRIAVIENVSGALCLAQLTDEERAILMSFTPTEVSKPYLITENYYQEEEDPKYWHLTKKEKNAHIVPIRTEPKIGRNDPCSCGSGKKFKKCCINPNT